MDVMDCLSKSVPRTRNLFLYSRYLNSLIEIRLNELPMTAASCYVIGNPEAVQRNPRGRRIRRLLKQQRLGCYAVVRHPIDATENGDSHMPVKHPAVHAMRRHLLKLLAAGALTGADLTGLVRQALAAGSGPQRKQGIFRLEGEATFNGKTLQVGDVPTLPLTVVTGPRTTLVFVVGADAYLVRANSHLILSSHDDKTPNRASNIKLLAGKLLSVFEKSERTLTTTTAVAGIRGTGIYLESEPGQSYLCLCYGTAQIGPIATPQVRETIKTTHHESPRMVYPDRMEPATLINHSDQELILLESLTGRLPPFYAQGDGIQNDLAKKRY
jgi:hypothetical protein